MCTTRPHFNIRFTVYITRNTDFDINSFHIHMRMKTWAYVQRFYAKLLVEAIVCIWLALMMNFIPLNLEQCSD